MEAISLDLDDGVSIRADSDGLALTFDDGSVVSAEYGSEDCFTLETVLVALAWGPVEELDWRVRQLEPLEMEREFVAACCFLGSSWTCYVHGHRAGENAWMDFLFDNSRVHRMIVDDRVAHEGIPEFLRALRGVL